MSAHDTQYGKIARYLQDQLAGEELDEFRNHLAACPACTAELQQERTLSALLRQSSPLYEAPAECVERVHGLLAQHDAEQTATPRKSSTSAPGWLRLFTWEQRWRVLVPAGVLAILCLFILPNLVQQARADSYVRTAVTSYHNVVESRLPLGIRSSSANEVTAWISRRVPFRFQLPTPDERKQMQPAYRLTGASLIGIKNHPAAVLTYEKDREMIVLLVASDQDATVAGGHRIQHQNLAFHYFNVHGSSVITWASHGLSYALVTSYLASERGLRPCLICHQNMTDHRAFQIPRQP